MLIFSFLYFFISCVFFHSVFYLTVQNSRQEGRTVTQESVLLLSHWKSEIYLIWNFYDPVTEFSYLLYLIPRSHNKLEIRENGEIKTQHKTPPLIRNRAKLSSENYFFLICWCNVGLPNYERILRDIAEYKLGNGR